MAKPYCPTYNSIKYTHVRLVKLQNCKISCTMGCIEANNIYDPLQAGKVFNIIAVQKLLIAILPKTTEVM